MPGPVETRIRARLELVFAPHFLEVENESFRHSVPRGSETHFKVMIVSDKFEGLNRIARQRLVNEALKAELAGEIHALSQKTLTPAEWQASSDAQFESPPCLGGSKAEKKYNS